MTAAPQPESRVFQPSTVRGTANAPHGAMQFELVEQLTVDANPFLWVMPKRRESFIDAQKRQCGCTEIYPVVLELLPPTYNGGSQRKR